MCQAPHFCPAPPACRAGEHSPSGRNGGGNATCRLCSAGQFSMSGSTTCSNCAPGTYAGTSGASNCTLCPPGAFSVTSRSINCTLCPVGTFSAFKGATSCTTCTDGWTNEHDGSDRCSLPSSTSIHTRATPSPAPATTPPALVCEGDTKAFSVNGIDLCVPPELYPAENVSHCMLERTWGHVKENRYIFQTGGLGKKMQGDAWKVWVCGAQLPCALEAHDWVCFTYHEIHNVFVPLGYNRELLIVRKC